MNKGTHFNGQPMYGQLISLLDRVPVRCSEKQMLKSPVTIQR